MTDKCGSYHIRKRTKYFDPATVAYITGKWPESNGIISEEFSECWGTKERDECSCGGDRMRCDFYSDVREKEKQKKLEARDCIQVAFDNDGTYDNSCLNAPIIDRRGKEPVVVGIISAVDEDKVTGVVWAKKMQRELSTDGMAFSFEIC